MERNLPAVATKEAPDELKPLEVSGKLDIATMVKSVGAVKLTDEQKNILFAPVKEDEIEIRPDGLVYLPWVFYHGRLRSAFGWEYAMVPKGEPKYIENANLMVWGFYMVIKGSLMGFVLGENGYHPNNRTMSYGDAIEGCKSNALMRLCKDLGISTELWQPEFVRRWKEERAYKGADGKWYKKTEDQREKPPSTKTTAYLAVENEIALTIEDPDFTGMIMYQGHETDLDHMKQETKARLGSGTIYKQSTFEGYRDTLVDMLKYAKEIKEVHDELGDDELQTRPVQDDLDLGTENLQE